MTPYYDSGDGRCVIYCGDCVDVMRDLPSESVQCVVTSPPYWGLRDYGVPGQIGLEPTMAEYVARMVDVFREAEDSFLLSLAAEIANRGNGTRADVAKFLSRHIERSKL